MNELIPVNYEKETPTVSGRDLHQFLEIETRYNDWFPRMVEYGFTEGKDYCSFLSNGDGFGKAATRTDHALTLAMAKEICMIQRSDKGKQARQYFLQIQEAWNTPEMVMSRALKMADDKIRDLQHEVREKDREIEARQPLYQLGAAVSASGTSILLGDFAKIMKQNGLNIGQNRFFDWLREKEYLCKDGSRRNMPTQKSMDLGLMEYNSTVITSSGRTRTRYTPKLTAKGQLYFMKKFESKIKPRAEQFDLLE